MEKVLKQIVNPFIYDEIESRVKEDAYCKGPTITPWLQQTYAQRYEDIILLSMLDAYALKCTKPLKYGYVEIGANHPISTSSTFLLQQKYGCYGILVEPNPELAECLKKQRPKDIVMEAACVPDDSQEEKLFICKENELSSMDYRFIARFEKKGDLKEVKKVKAININAVLENTLMLWDIYSLFIDVEGPDVEILEAIDYKKHRPITIQVEVSDTIRPGNSDRIRKVMEENGYVFIANTFINFIFFDGERLP